MGLLSFISNFAHKQEMNESKDEIIVGEIITAMSDLGFPVVGIMSDMDYQRIRFRTIKDPILHAVTVTLDRKTGGLAAMVVGTQASLIIQAEVKNYLADPDDLLHMYKTDFQNILKIPILGDVKINHELNSIFGTTVKLINIDKFLGSGVQNVAREELKNILMGEINRIKEKIASHKKKSAIEPQL